MRSFVQHEHTDLDAGIERIHATACEIASIPADRLSPDPRGRHWIEHV